VPSAIHGATLRFWPDMTASLAPPECAKQTPDPR
jgi:hypothetical protein